MTVMTSDPTVAFSGMLATYPPVGTSKMGRLSLASLTLKCTVTWMRKSGALRLLKYIASHLSNDRWSVEATGMC